MRAEDLLGECELQMASGPVRLGHIAALHANLAAGGVKVYARTRLDDIRPVAVAESGAAVPEPP